MSSIIRVFTTGNRLPKVIATPAVTTTLLGPPEIYKQNPSAAPTTIINFNQPSSAAIFTMWPTFRSTGNPCSDLFFHAVPNISHRKLKQLLRISWDHDPLKTLKLICNLRGLRGAGKFDKENYYTAVLWLHENHPKTLAFNVTSFAKFGYLKDLPEILFRLLQGSRGRKLAKEMCHNKFKALRKNFPPHRRLRGYYSPQNCCDEDEDEDQNQNQYQYQYQDKSVAEYEEWISAILEEIERANKNTQLVGRAATYLHNMDFVLSHLKAINITTFNNFFYSIISFPSKKMINSWVSEEIERAKKFSKFEENSSANSPKFTREEKKIERAKKVIERFNSDPNFKILHDRVSGLFADYLRSDMKLIGNGDCNNISLAAKWCPSLDSSYDQYTLLCEAIAKKVFPREEYEEYVEIEEGHYAYRVRDRLRKQVLVPLRKAMELPEVYIGANDWGSISYNRVPSVAMRLYKEKFKKHDGERFKEYRRKVEEEKAKIKAAGALLPHEIIASLDDEDGGQVAELQWKRMVDDMLKKGKLSNCIAVCDFQTRGLRGIRKDAFFALGILLSELSAEPWKGKLIPFSDTPVLRRVEGVTLKEKTESLKRMKIKGRKYCYGYIDLSKVYDRILDAAVHGGLKPDEMIKRIFVLSVGNFNKASIGHNNRRSWEEIYEATVRKYRESGYGDSVPEMVFWNLKESKATVDPTKILHGNFPGVSMVNGISKKLMKLFLEGGDMNPVAVMDAAISGEEYKKLVLLD